MPALLHWLKGVQTKWKAAWWSVLVLLYELFFRLYALFVLAEQECGLFRYVLRTALLCTPILSVTTSLRNIGEAAVAVESAQTVTIIRYYCDYFFDYTHYFTTKSRIFGLDFIARPFKSQSKNPSGQSLVSAVHWRGGEMRTREFGAFTWTP